MKLTHLQDSGDGFRTIEIRCDVISFHNLLRCLRKLHGCSLSETAENFLTDDARAIITYKGQQFRLTAPFSDYWINFSNQCPGEVVSEFIAYLENYKVRWYEKLL